jgi:hypothetical protein
MLVDNATVSGGGGSTYLVEPNSGESWTITAHWQAAAACVTPYTEVATVDVDWNGSVWVLSNETLTDSIVDISASARRSPATIAI